MAGNKPVSVLAAERLWSVALQVRWCQSQGAVCAQSQGVDRILVASGHSLPGANVPSLSFLSWDVFFPASCISTGFRDKLELKTLCLDSGWVGGAAQAAPRSLPPSHPLRPCPREVL